MENSNLKQKIQNNMENYSKENAFGEYFHHPIAEDPNNEEKESNSFKYYY